MLYLTDPGCRSPNRVGTRSISAASHLGAIRELLKDLHNNPLLHISVPSLEGTLLCTAFRQSQGLGDVTPPQFHFFHHCRAIGHHGDLGPLKSSPGV